MARRVPAGRENARVRLADAASPGKQGFDGVACFSLLHEAPDPKKHQIVNALLEAVRPGGKVVFVDYHRLVPWHPLRPVMAAVIRWLEPFADGLVSRLITDFAAHPQDFH
ncbi:MAG: class I SAM-dependent methyltransferase [Gammaproteobacteria bacterium]|nr:class I SAM-dependent methyltransferase [Gammaproteobacteria bacterium]